VGSLACLMSVPCRYQPSMNACSAAAAGTGIWAAEWTACQGAGDALQRLGLAATSNRDWELERPGGWDGVVGSERRNYGRACSTADVCSRVVASLGHQRAVGGESARDAGRWHGPEELKGNSANHSIQNYFCCRHAPLGLRRNSSCMV
jgi:hypothetical protein